MSSGRCYNMRGASFDCRSTARRLPLRIVSSDLLDDHPHFRSVLQEKDPVEPAEASMDMVRFGDQRRDLPGSPCCIHRHLVARPDFAGDSLKTAITGVRVITVAQMSARRLVRAQALLHPSFEVGIFAARNIARSSIRGEIVPANLIDQRPLFRSRRYRGGPRRSAPPSASGQRPRPITECRDFGRR